MAEREHDKVTLISDLRDFGIMQQDSAAMRFSINVFTNYYPERLSKILNVRAPWLFMQFWKIISPWLDPMVRAKVRFLEAGEVANFIDESEMVEVVGGKRPDFQFAFPSEKELENLRVFRESPNKQVAWNEYVEATDKFKEATIQWCTSESAEALNERNVAIEKLKVTYKKLSPYIRAPTNYHRQKLLVEPEFNSILFH